MDAIPKPLILEHLQRKQNNQCLPIANEVVPEKYKKEVNALIWKFI
jgi:hypothetical protein